MIEYHRGRFGGVLAWRSWVFGFTFGPEVYEFHLGPLMLWFDPEGINDPGYAGQDRGGNDG